MSQKKVVLVTGASSGIGQAIAALLAHRGFAVFGTSRSPSDAAPIAGAEMLPLDVCLDEPAGACVEMVLKRTGRLDVLGNNAGYGMGGAAEETSMEEAKAQLETNFWGVVRMTKAALPAMRRQGSGKIVNISSALGVVGAPFAGFYAASKFALEGYTESLSYELKPLNIRVSLVEPLSIKTNFFRNLQPTAGQIDDYAPWRERAFKAMQEKGQEASAPTVVAECVLRIINNRTPRLRYQVGKNASLLYWLIRRLPAPMVEQMMRRVWNLDAKD